MLNCIVESELSTDFSFEENNPCTVLLSKLFVSIDKFLASNECCNVLLVINFDDIKDDARSRSKVGKIWDLDTCIDPRRFLALITCWATSGLMFYKIIELVTLSAL